MQFRNTIIALVLLAIVGGFAYLVSQGEKTAETLKLFKLAPEDITKIDLQYPEREIVLERNREGKWELSKPIRADADQTTSDNLARAIAECEIKKTVFEKPSDLKPFGLDKPLVTVTVTTKSKGVLPGIAVGKTTPVGFSAYIKTADKPAVLLTTSAFPPGMEKKVDDLRDRELMSFKVDDAQKLAIERDDGSVIEVDRAGDNWNIVKPAKYSADPTQIRQLLSALANARVADFIADTPPEVSEFGLGKPHLTVTVFTGREGARQSLLFGFKQAEQGKDGIYVRRGERTPVYTVHPYVMSDADKKVLDLRDKTVLGVASADVNKFLVTSVSYQFSVQRAGAGKWQLVDGGKSDADGAAVERFLGAIRFLKGSAIVADPMTDPKKFGMDVPAEEIVLTGKDGKDLGSIKLAKAEQPASQGETPVSSGRFDYYVVSSKGSAVYAIDDYTFSQLNKTADQFRSHAQPSAKRSPSK